MKQALAGCEGDGDAGGGKGGTGGAGAAGAAGGTGGTGGSAGGTGGTGGMTSNLSCEAYCADVQMNCANGADGNYQQYGDEEVCKTICATFPIGKDTDTDGNTLGCRTYHGGTPASMAPGDHCGHAGPLGNKVCGNDECAVFCGIADAICGDEAAPPFDSVAACTAACTNWMDTTAVPYNTTVTAGDSLSCRMYHLTVASTSDAAGKTLHCGHIKATSDQCK
jgi:hypothetical protein